MRLIDADAVKLPKGFFEKVDNVPKFYEWLDAQPTIEPKRGKWIVRKRHEHFPSGKEYTELVCPFCGRTDHNGDGCYCGYCGERVDGEL